MFYDFTLTIPAGKLKAAPATLELKLVPGIVHRVEIMFPPGPRGTAHVAIFSNSHQVWPTNPDGSFASDREVIKFDERYKLETPAFFTLKGWAPTATKNHTITFRFGILPEEAAWTIEELLAAYLGVPTPVGA